jgi:hypothetical protein
MTIETSSWQKIDEKGFMPDYVDVPGDDLRSYGASVVVDETPECYTVSPDGRQLIFLKYFTTFFLPLFVVVSFAFIPGSEKWIFVIGGPICGAMAFSVIYSLLSHEINKGPYFAFYPKEAIVRLPRYGVEYNLDAIECLQWITGGSKNRGMDRATDLNLVVRTQDGEKRRYFLLGSPRKKLAVEISDKLKIPVTEINLGTHGMRDVDVRSAR